MKRMLLAASVAFALPMLTVTIPATAQDYRCDTGQGQVVTLDFKKGLDNQPLMNTDLRGIGWLCVDGPSKYLINNVPGIAFNSPSDALEFVKTVVKLRSLPVSTDPKSIYAAVDAVQKIAEDAKKARQATR